MENELSMSNMHIDKTICGFSIDDIDKFDKFTDLELYIIKRAFIESCGQICYYDRYSSEEKDTFEKLLNIVTLELK